MSVNWKQRKYLMAERNSEKQNWHSTDNPLEISACDISEGSLAGENNRSILQLCQNFVSYSLCEKLKKSQQILNFCFYVTIFSKCFFFSNQEKKEASESFSNCQCWVLSSPPSHCEQQSCAESVLIPWVELRVFRLICLVSAKCCAKHREHPEFPTEAQSIYFQSLHFKYINSIRFYFVLNY